MLPPPGCILSSSFSNFLQIFSHRYLFRGRGLSIRAVLGGSLHLIYAFPRVRALCACARISCSCMDLCVFLCLLYPLCRAILLSIHDVGGNTYCFRLQGLSCCDVSLLKGGCYYALFNHHRKGILLPLPLLLGSLPLYPVKDAIKIRLGCYRFPIHA